MTIRTITQRAMSARRGRACTGQSRPLRDRAVRVFAMLVLALGGAAACGSGGGGGGAGRDTTPPVVTATYPANNAMDVPVEDLRITATFSEPVDPATVTVTAMSVRSGFNTRAGTISYSGTTATFTPNAVLENGSMYTVHVTPTITDAAGNSLPVDYFWTFTTAPPPDRTAPTIVSTAPAAGAVSVPEAGEIKARFSEPMDPATLTAATFLVEPNGGSPVAGAVSYDPDSVSAVFRLPQGVTFDNNATYTARLTTDVADPAGNHLAAEYAWSFTIEPFPDLTPPNVVSTSPRDHDTRVPLSGVVRARFNEAIQPTTLNASTFVVGVQGGSAVTGTISYDVPSFTATFTPSVPLQSGTTYEARLTTGVTDASVRGNALATDYVWTFTIVAPRFAFVAHVNSNDVTIFSVEPDTGVLTPVGATSVGPGLSGLAVDQTGRFVYVVSQASNAVTAFRFDPTTPALQEVSVALAGSAPSSVTVDPSGRFVYVANRDTGNVAMFRMNPLTNTLDRIGFAQTNATPVSVAVHPSGLFAYVANQGSGVSRFQIDQNAGSLSGGQLVSAGTQPISVAVDPSGRFAYTANRLSATVTTFGIDQTTGLLTKVGSDTPAGSNPAAVAVDPSGRFVYVANRGANTVSAYRIDQGTGALTAVAPAVAAGSQPSSVCVDPSGQFVYVTNLESDNVTVLRVNQSTGALTQPVTVPAGDGPTAVAVIGAPN